MKQLPVQSTSLDDYSDLVSDVESPDWVSFLALNPRKTNCRLVVFTPEISANPDFRAAWRRDIDLLRQLPHDGLPQFQESGDDDGIVYVATEPPSGLTLQKFLTSRSPAWDETADLGWQAASVIQHLHNSGIAHGGLNSDSFRISAQLRVSLVDTGVGRWLLAAKDPASANNLSACYQSDLIAIGRFLQLLAGTNESESTRSSLIPQRWWELIADLSDAANARFPATAREFQGRLGGILLEDSGEAMDVVAEQSGPGQSRRSIVDELLDVPESNADALAQHNISPRFSIRIAIGLLLLIAIVVTLVGVIALLR